MKIANWNLQRINPSENRAQLICDQMKSINADIWVLTETHELVGPGEHFSSVMSGKHDLESNSGEHWASIWSRYPMKPLPSFVSDESRCTAALIVHPDFGDVTVYATVLPWNGSKWRGIESAGGAAFEAALKAYKSDWQRLRAAFPNALHVVAGDFNQDLAPYHYYGSKKQRELLQDALTETHMVAVTANANDPIETDSAHRHACIDHICVSDSPLPRVIQTTRWPESGKPNLQLSDHFGVAVDLTVNFP
jgi:hypothetical protein